MSRVKKIIYNIVGICLMATGPFLMVIPGPQVISWFGLFLFLYANRDLLKKYQWYLKLERKCFQHLGKVGKYQSFNTKSIY